MNKAALFVFNGDPMCFIHVLLNALDLHERGTETTIVIEGAATKLIPQLAEEANPLHGLWVRTVEAGLVAGACKACAGIKAGSQEHCQKYRAGSRDWRFEILISPQNGAKTTKVTFHQP